MGSSTIERGAAAIVVFLMAVIAWLLSLCASGFVTYSLWSWFLTPLGIPALQGYAHALGIGLLVTYLTIRIDGTTKDTGYWEKMGTWVVWYSFIWCFGWVIHQVMT